MSTSLFKIHGICLVRDEVDVVAQSLSAASKWCDRIYVYDNGSTDGTWEQVQEIAEKTQNIVPFKQDAKPFHNGLRSEVFNHYREEISCGDWWCILDADEFYIDDPWLFLAKVPRHYGAVWSASFQYYFSDHDWSLYQQDPELYADDVPVEKKLRYYLNNWSELRFFRHHAGLEWGGTRGSPTGLLPACPLRIWLKHYQYRSPQQIEKRLKLRVTARQPFVHEVQRYWHETVLDASTMSHDRTVPGSEVPEWQDRIMPAAHLYCDAHDGRYIVREDLMPSLPFNLRYRLKQLVCESVRRIFKRS